MEPFLIEPPVGSIERGPEVVNFELVEEASKQRRTKLIDSRGYTYNVKRRTQSATVWQCSVRTKSTYCKATVKQIEDEFIITQSHNHQPAVGAVTAAKLVDEVPVNPLTRKLICFHGQIIVCYTSKLVPKQLKCPRYVSQRRNMRVGLIDSD